jgi:threonine aldolase
MTIDLRSDTVTQPTKAMKEAMWAAPLGDDVFSEDPTVKKLEEKCATLLGMDAAVFCPSGTMTNQIGIKVLTRTYEEVICYKGAHIYKYEGGGVAGTSGVSMRLLDGDRGRIRVSEIEPNINNPNDAHQPLSTVVALENTVVREAGSYYTLQQVATVSEFARSRGLKMHLDGARLFNALAVTGDAAHQYGQYFDTISICLSKGLGAPVGSVLACKKEYEPAVRRMRKVLGGGMRQAGLLAAGGIFALDNHRARLTEDHARAQALGRELQGQSWVASVMPVDTNIVIFTLENGVTPQQWLTQAASHGVKALAFGPQQIRLVTHLDFTDAMLTETVRVIRQLTF